MRVFDQYPGESLFGLGVFLLMVLGIIAGVTFAIVNSNNQRPFVTNVDGKAKICVYQDTDPGASYQMRWECQ